MYNFDLSGQELKSFQEWDAEHYPQCVYYDDNTQPISKQGAIGGRLTFSFTPTGIGVAVSVKCACGAEKDVTDFASW